MVIENLEIKPRERTRLVVKCIVCYRTYTKTKPTQKVCSKLCKLHLDMAKNRVIRLRAAGVEEVELQTKNCVICGDEFDQIQPNYVCCGKESCTKERRSQTHKSWAEINR